MDERRLELALVRRAAFPWVGKRGGHVAARGGLLGNKSPRRLLVKQISVAGGRERGWSAAVVSACDRDSK